MITKSRILRVFYNALLTGMPIISNNAYNKNTLYASFTVDNDSTYINYKLNRDDYTKIYNYINNDDINPKYLDNKLDIKKIGILKDDSLDYYLSINIYNCTSPLFNTVTTDYVTRCEINTYVIDKDHNLGTLIIDYASNYLSLDPDNLIKLPSTTIYNKINNYKYYSKVSTKNIDLEFNIEYNKLYYYDRINPMLVEYSDYIYYVNGVYDKLFYDSSLLKNTISFSNNYNINCTFLGINLNNPDSVFKFKDPINFVGGMWDNLEKK